MELWDYVRVLRKRWRLALVVPLLAVLVAGLVTERATPQYQSSVKFFISTPATSADNGAAYTGGLFSQQRVKSYADLLTGPRLAAEVTDDLAGGGIRDVTGYQVTARAQPETVLLSATVTHESPRVAQAVAAAIGRQFPALLAELERPTSGGAPAIKATVVADPELPASPVSPRPVRNLALAAVIGALVGVGLAVARESLDRTVKTPDDVRDLTGLSLLGAVAYDGRATKRPLIVHDDRWAPRAEAFRQLRTNLQFVQVDGALTSLTVTSSLPGEGKSTTACNLAITLADAGIKVLLVDGDLRRPTVPEYLGIEGGIGLTSVLIGRATLDDVIQKWGANGLSVLPAGPLPPNPSELLSSAGMRELMRTLESRFDVVVVDASPLLPVTDAAVLATITSGALLCIQAGRIHREQLARAVDALRTVDASVLGAVLTMVPLRGPDAYHGYGGYGYRYHPDDKAKRLDEREALDALRIPAETPAAAPAVSAPKPVPPPPPPPPPPAEPVRQLVEPLPSRPIYASVPADEVYDAETDAAARVRDDDAGLHA